MWSEKYHGVDRGLSKFKVAGAYGVKPEPGGTLQSWSLGSAEPPHPWDPMPSQAPPTLSLSVHCQVVSWFRCYFAYQWIFFESLPQVNEADCPVPTTCFPLDHPTLQKLVSFHPQRRVIKIILQASSNKLMPSQAFTITSESIILGRPLGYPQTCSSLDLLPQQTAKPT